MKMSTLTVPPNFDVYSFPLLVVNSTRWPNISLPFNIPDAFSILSLILFYYFDIQMNITFIDIFKIHDGRDRCAPPLKVTVQGDGKLVLRSNYKTGSGEK